MNEPNADIHIEHYFPKGYDPDSEPWKSIRAHHAKLRAENAELQEAMSAELIENKTLRDDIAVARAENERLQHRIADIYALADNNNQRKNE